MVDALLPQGAEGVFFEKYGLFRWKLNNPKLTAVHSVARRDHTVLNVLWWPFFCRLPLPLLHRV